MSVEIEVAGSHPIPVERIFCIGRNYAAHAAELGNEVPDEPVVFMKPASAVHTHGPIVPPNFGSEFHHEAEVVIAIEPPAARERVESEQSESTPSAGPIELADARAWVGAIGLGLDLTLRDVQRTLKAKGLPWERAKAFDGAAPVGRLVRCDADLDLAALHFEARVNDQVRQRGDTALMLFSIPTLVSELSKVWRLRAGDLVFTGTPAGVGPLRAGERVELRADWCPPASWTVAGA